jgi:hypothetical protein
MEQFFRYTLVKSRTLPNNFIHHSCLFNTLVLISRNAYGFQVHLFAKNIENNIISGAGENLLENSRLIYKFQFWQLSQMQNGLREFTFLLFFIIILLISAC